MGVWVGVEVVRAPTRDAPTRLVAGRGMGTWSACLWSPRGGGGCNESCGSRPPVVPPAAAGGRGGLTRVGFCLHQDLQDARMSRMADRGRYFTWMDRMDRMGVWVGVEVGSSVPKNRPLCG